MKNNEQEDRIQPTIVASVHTGAAQADAEDDHLSRAI
jgi:hypothetical protein